MLISEGTVDAKNYARETGLQAVELQVNAKNKNAYHSYINKWIFRKVNQHGI